ncbi:MAG: 30S ribosomal protein S3, partial [Kiritimatiellae bacterium]|nr:30S ribosomal protein S3 [Kiritimatiellia bacterium]
LERRISFRRAVKRAVQLAMDLGAEGIRVQVSGRLGGSELSRTEGYKDGKVPLHTLRANVEYGFTEANTVAGKIGVKVWVCKKQVAAEEVKEKSHATYA